MRSASLRDVAGAVEGVLDGPGRLTVSGVSTDTRAIGKNNLFVALRGEDRDGHSFLAEARKAGARAAVVEERNPWYERFRASDSGFPVVVVRDTLKALGDLAVWARSRLDLKAVGITGSTGKTCTKDLLVAALGVRYEVASSPGSYNNEIGAPLTVFGANGKHQVLVAEMGARHPGDIERLAKMIKPCIGIVTNVGVTHLEIFETEERVADTKAELARALPSDGVLFLNAEDRWSAWMAKQTAAEVVRFGYGKGAGYRASRVKLDPEGRPSFQLSGPGFSVNVGLPAAGRHQVLNACAASACAHRLGVPPDGIAEGLRDARLSAWRMEITEAPGGYLVINDAYNANPHSMRAALETLASIGSGRRKIAVLGGMAELGRGSREFHSEVGRQLVEFDVDLLVAVGRSARDYTTSAHDAGLPRGSAFRCGNTEEARAILSQILEPGDVVLVKASRVQGLDRLAGALGAVGCPESHKKAAANV